MPARNSRHEASQSTSNVATCPIYIQDTLTCTCAWQEKQNQQSEVDRANLCSGRHGLQSHYELNKCDLKVKKNFGSPRGIIPFAGGIARGDCVGKPSMPFVVQPSLCDINIVFRTVTRTNGAIPEYRWHEQFNDQTGPRTASKGRTVSKYGHRTAPKASAGAIVQTCREHEQFEGSNEQELKNGS